MTRVRPLPKRGTRAWRALKAEVIRARPLVCVHCRISLDPDAKAYTRYAIELDHIVPVAIGGESLEGIDAADQVVLACYPCNRSRGRHLVMGDGGLAQPMQPTPPEPRTFVTSRKW